ncbi:prephenate dehydrogenase/arogenate dehydrogenase family protein [Amycolatopsis sp. NPDC059657]|uniref:prephenate dehydrogenase/arogenate dehydrogenase family protein n=1 Tax=Amycolatopsis sp. NPDC059657 TaxID=3346899 RepID=UPI00366AE349
MGGTGAVGGLFAGRLRGSGAEVTIVDATTGGDITKIDAALAEELGKADLVVLAVPEPVALKALSGISHAMRPDALLVDTLSVKEPFVTAAREYDDGEMLSVNPMFAPSLGFEGRPVAAVVVREGPRGRELVRLIESWGARIVEVTEHEHDRLAGASQALTHAAVLSFGLALTELDVGIEELSAIAPPPHKTMLALLARVASGTPEVYWDVQAGNPQAVPARKALAGNIHRLAEMVETGNEAAFTTVLDSLRDFLGTDLVHYQDLCAEAFKTL